MKKAYLIICTILAVMLMSACNKKNISGLNVSGDCTLDSLVLNDTFEAAINPLTRVARVKVPVDFTAKDAMTVSTLKISDGAKANIAQGEIVNFEAPKALHITNGDLYLDWTVMVKNDEARITSFILNGTYKASIDEELKTITAKLPASVDVTSLVPTIVLSDEDAVVSPKSGVVRNFSEPVQYTVTDRTAKTVYTVKVELITAPSAIFLGSNGAGKLEDLCGEEREACKWMLGNIDNSMFVSWEELRNNAVDLSKCEIIWWHWQGQPTQSLGDFEGATASTAMKCLNVLSDHYKKGGAFVLSRTAVNFAAKLGATRDGICANNCWGTNDDDNANNGAIWDFPAMDESGYLWEGIIGGFPVKLNDQGYQLSNCTSQWGMWDFRKEGNQSYDAWTEATGCRILAHGWDGDGNIGAVTIWECPAYDGSFGKGGIVCFGSGCYDWYSPTPFTENYHKNMGIITGNAFNHLTK